MADIENQPPFGDLELDDPFSRPQISEEDKDEEDEISEEAKRAKWAERCNELFEDIKLEKVVKAVDEEEKVSDKRSIVHKCVKQDKTRRALSVT